MGLLDHAKQLRTSQTDAEQRLWYHLRAQRFLGLKFKRQKPVGRYIADFVCMEYRLVIEADGGQHGGVADEQRDAWFKAQGFTVLRFWNHEILGQTQAVLERIRETVIALSPDPSPASGRGEETHGSSPASGAGEETHGSSSASGAGEETHGSSPKRGRGK